ncbi:response regulator transcription factor [Alkalihalobacterium chitinilyticum]|uniref:Response regulator transcription factor n=1 Tax=Alkalihalobacterium chitinilyticum TaxID=2980103 RepID=A0ABT5VFU2_9BACI|nr:response regulator transcription factor [Alkalihalobacterium chitinilyticum]MDE5414326.1 response regulator transcription factor [Alkalihalobacterium chitinilyticum]
MYRLLLIEDDQELGSLIKESLERYGYVVFQQTDFKAIMEDFHQFKPDLVLLDINLPYYDGYFLCRSIRKASNVPIIMVSARSDEMDQIMAIELGADDYLTKPFTFEILHSKVKATLRRVYGEYAQQDRDELQMGDLILNLSTLTMSYGQSRVELSKNELKLMKKFIENEGKYLSREILIEEVWDDLTFVDDNTLTVNITRIRQKLLTLGIHDAIKSKRGVGYIFDTKVFEGQQG